MVKHSDPTALDRSRSRSRRQERQRESEQHFAMERLGSRLDALISAIGSRLDAPVRPPPVTEAEAASVKMVRFKLVSALSEERSYSFFGQTGKK